MVRITNQGAGDAGVRNIKVTDYVPSGLVFEQTDNPGWTIQGGNPTTFVTVQLLPGQSIELPLVLRAATTVTELDNGTPALRNQTEISSFVRMNTTPSGAFMTAADKDSTPDAYMGNDGPAIDNEIAGAPGQTPNDEDDADYENIAITTGTPPVDPPVDPDEPPQDPPAPTVQEFVLNRSLETDMFGWTNIWGNATRLSRSSMDAHDGMYALRVDTTSQVLTSSGVTNYQNRWVTSTVNGKLYAASAWIKPSVPGMRICVRQTEYAGSSNVGFTETCAIHSDTTWRQLTNTKIAGDSGRSMTISVYASSLKAGQYFLADNFSITAPLE